MYFSRPTKPRNLGLVFDYFQTRFGRNMPQVKKAFAKVEANLKEGKEALVAVREGLAGLNIEKPMRAVGEFMASKPLSQAFVQLLNNSSPSDVEFEFTKGDSMSGFEGVLKHGGKRHEFNIDYNYLLPSVGRDPWGKLNLVLSVPARGADGDERRRSRSASFNLVVLKDSLREKFYRSARMFASDKQSA